MSLPRNAVDAMGGDEGVRVMVSGAALARRRHDKFKFLLVGDVLFACSIGRTDFPMGNHQDLLDAITGKLWPLGDEVTFVPGHGQPSTFGRERQSNPFVSDAAIAAHG